MDGDYAGLPLNAAGRWRAQSWAPENFEVPEWVCRPHAWDFSVEAGAAQLRLWTEIDNPTQEVIAYHGRFSMREQETTMWMDGRPHPPDYVLHTWSGFSTGKWEGKTLVQTATHLKEAVALAADYADDVVIESPMAGVHTGRVAAEQAIRAIFEAFLDRKMKTESLLIDGDRVAHVVTVEGTHIGQFMGMPPSGKRFRFTAVFLCELRDRKIICEQRIYDFTGLLVQVGVVKARPA